MLAVSVLGCEGLLSTEPPPSVIVERTLGDVSYAAPRTSDGYTSVQAYVPAGDTPLAAHERVLIQLSTSGGDSEQLEIGPGVCKAGLSTAICREYVVMLGSAAQFAAAANAVDALGARMNRIGSASSEFAVVYVFAPAEAIVRQQIAALAEVTSIERNQLISIGFPTVTSAPMLHAALKVEPGSTRVSGDGTLTVQVGDVITLTYPGVGGAPQTITRTVVE